MPDTVLIIIGFAIVVVLLAGAMAVMLVRRRRTRRPKPTPATTAVSSPTGARPKLSAEDQQLLATLIGPAESKSKSASVGARLLPNIPIPPVVEEKKQSIGLPASREAKAAPTMTGPKSKIRILVVDDNKDTRENVSRLLAFEDDMEVIGQAFNGRQGLEMAVELRPHIVLMDINMPDMDGITATREMVVQVPYSQIIIMSVQFETDYMRAAMLAGARDYQTKPFSADELVNCIRRVYERGLSLYQQTETAERTQSAKSEVAIVQALPEGAAAPVFMVYSPKGGGGKTALAINLAAALQHEHGGVTLLDADLQMGDLPVDLNMRPTATITDLVSSSRPNPELLSKVLVAHSCGVNVLFAPQTPEQMELITGNMMIQIVRALRNQAKAVVIDTASYLTDHNLALMEIANEVLLVISPDLPSVKNAKIFLELAPGLGVAPDHITLVINRATLPGAIPIAQIEKALKATRIFTVSEDPKLRLALIKGVSIFQLDSNAPAALAIAQLATAMWKRLFEPQPVVVEAAPKS